MKSFFNDERRMLLYTYLLLIAMFGNLSLLQQPFDTKAVILGVVMALLLGYAHFVIGRFFSDGDKSVSYTHLDVYKRQIYDL